MFKFNRFCTIALLATILTITGCATPQIKAQEHFFWPRLPERPRIEWIKSYSGQADFQKSDFNQFIENIAGSDIEITVIKPVTIASNGEGKVYVVDNDRNALGVHVFDFKNNVVNSLGKEKAFGLFEFPIAVALDEEGNIYVADISKDSISVFDKNEKPTMIIETKEFIEKIGGLAIDKARKRILVTDYTDHKLFALDFQGKQLFSIGKRGNEDGQFNFPAGLTVNHKGEIIVADSMNARVQVFTGDGKFLRKFGKRGDAPGDLQILKGVAVDSDDNIYVTDSKGNKFEIFSSEGEYLLTVGGMYAALERGREAPGGFMLPQGIAIDKEDRIYVVDQMNRRFQVFQYISDSYLKANPITGYKP